MKSYQLGIFGGGLTFLFGTVGTYTVLSLANYEARAIATLNEIKSQNPDLKIDTSNHENRKQEYNRLSYISLGVSGIGVLVASASSLIGEIQSRKRKSSLETA